MSRPERNRLYMREYRDSHPEYAAKPRASSRRYYATHRSDEMLATARARSYTRYHSSPEVAKRQHLLRYGLTIEEFDQLLASQGGGCFFCGEAETNPRVNRLSVDHDHQTGRIRGIVCMDCNMSLAAVDRGGFSDLYRHPEKLSAYLGRDMKVTIAPRTARQRVAVDLWLRGKSPVEVADAMGITRVPAYALLRQSVRVE